jgi:hypothetical protein
MVKGTEANQYNDMICYETRATQDIVSKLETQDE